MKQRTSDFKNQIKELGRELSNKIGVYGDYKKVLATEDDKLMLTQDDVMLISKQIDGGLDFEILDNNLFNVNVVQNGKILSTMMKELDFESDLNLKVGTIVNYKLGLKINNDYEYLNYGDFIIYKKELNEDTKHWVYTCYDAMLKTMATVDDKTIIENTLIVNAIINIANKFELEINTPDELLDLFPNLEQSILTDTFKDIEMTYRDVLDQICQAVGCQLYVDNNEIKFKSINKIVEGKNIFDKDNADIQLGSIRADGTTTSTNTNFRTATAIPVEPNTTYTLSINTRVNDLRINEYDGQNNHILRTNQQSASKITITTTSTTKYLKWSLNYDLTTTFTIQTAKAKLDELNMQLEKGDEATEYEPYHEPEYKQVSVDTINKTYLKDINVTFKEKYGPINSLVLSRSEDNDNANVKDDTSIEKNGLHEFKIKDNLILNNQDRDDFINNIFNQIKGLEFYINDYQSVGICYLDWLDTYNVEINNNSYQCLMLNDEIKVKSGLSETIYTESPEETVSDYTTMTKSDKEVSFIVDKQKGEISSKVSKDGVISSINQSAEQISIDANKISLAGKNIALTSDNITISSTNFNVDSNGNITANSGTFGGTINTSQDCTVGNNLYVGQNQASSGVDFKYIYFNQNDYIQRVYSASVRGIEMHGEIVSRMKVGNSTISVVSDQVSMRTDAGGEFYVYNNEVHSSSQIIVNSDQRLKQNIKEIDTSFINELKVKEFEYKNTPDKKQIGLIAQDYIDKEYSKYFLNEDENGYYSIAYGNITNALVQYCQELKQRIDKLEQEIELLKRSDK